MMIGRLSNGLGILPRTMYNDPRRQDKDASVSTGLKRLNPAIAVLEYLY